MDMLCIMHSASGYLTVNGNALDTAALAAFVGACYESVTSALQELLRNGVYSVADDGRIYCRRMVRDAEKRESVRVRVQKHRARNARNAECNAPCNADVTQSSIPISKSIGKDKSRTSKPPRDRAISLAVKLAEIQEEKRGILVSGQKRTAWADAIDRAERIDGVAFNRQAAAMDALEAHWGEPYWPVIQSGRSWREKLGQIEDAVTRTAAAPVSQRLSDEEFDQSVADIKAARADKLRRQRGE